jgi:hypothetical protein
VTDKGEQFVLEMRDDIGRRVIFSDENDNDDDLGEWLTSRESQAEEPARSIKVARFNFGAADKLHEQTLAKIHEQIVAEIRDEYPAADEREVKLRVAIRESICMTHPEEDDLRQDQRGVGASRRGARARAVKTRFP